MERKIYPRLRTINFETAQRAMDNFIDDMRILSGDIVGPSNASVHDVKQTALVNLRCLENYIEQSIPFKVFPEVRLTSK